MIAARNNIDILIRRIEGIELKANQDNNDDDEDNNNNNDNNNNCNDDDEEDEHTIINLRVARAHAIAGLVNDYQNSDSECSSGIPNHRVSSSCSSELTTSSSTSNTEISSTEKNSDEDDKEFHDIAYTLPPENISETSETSKNSELDSDGGDSADSSTSSMDVTQFMSI